jgi:MFS family permease
MLPAITDNVNGAVQQYIRLSSLIPITTGARPAIIALQIYKLQYGWTAPLTLSLLAGSIASLVGFVVVSLKSENPVLDFILFKNKIFSTCNLSLFFIGAVFFSVIIFIPLFMVNVLGISATKAGVSLVPLSLGVVTGSIISGQLVSRFGHYKRWMLGGIVLVSIGIFLLSNLSVTTTYWNVLLIMTLCGLGIGPSMPLYTLAIQNSVDPREIGQATSASQFFRQIGASIGTAVMGTVLAYTLSVSINAHLKHLPSGISLKSLHTSTSQILANGGSQIKVKLMEEAEREAGVIASGKKSNLPLLPDNYVNQLQEERKISLEKIKTVLKDRAEEVYSLVENDIKVSFNKAITTIYFYTLFIVGLAFLSTLLVPEIPLRKTNQHSAFHD